MANYEEKEISFDQISKTILKHFRIATEENFNILLNKLIENYDRNYDKNNEPEKKN